MSRVEFATVSLRLLGLVLLLLAVPELIRQAEAFLATMHWLDWKPWIIGDNLQGARDNFGFSIAGLIVALGQTAVSVYLLLRGRWLVRLLTRIDRSRCMECGYDMRGAARGEKCPECGSVRD
ncbi:MAG TPA: hypothetical protein VFF69_04315 [Phycisphaerales bacterium]|nr:hypothetical protein [Phycisphaerales bacterium]